ncbi:MAG: gliding motility-associated C-terminal domain-containing protein [Bacteroidales bacterium]|nr:gliding motility-associated C-terminal domain-containing protein [Bacteroidales bacterium]
MRERGPVEKKALTGVILFLLTIIPAWTQITSSTVDHVDTISYPVSPAEDPLFVFYQVNQVPKAGSLTATLPGTDNYNFEWRKYNPVLSGFDAPFNTLMGVQSSTLTDLLDGGYQVRIWDGGGTDTTMLAWVMLDHFRADCEKTADNLVQPYKYTCEFLVISGFVIPDTFVYYDPISHDAITLPVDFKFKWTSDNDELRIPNDTIVLDPNITYLPPIKDTWYILTATDDLGMVEVDSVLYESIQTKAKFTVEYYDKVSEEYDADLTGSWSSDKGSQDAQLTVQFINESENGASYEWVYLDTLGGIKEGETTYDVEDVVEFTYETADEYYYPYLVSVSEAGCIDTFRLEQAIFVVPSQLVIPNVFTPNGDGINDLFVFKHQSLQSCKITIVDRSGKIVYRRKIEDIYSWDGWDGNMHESGRRAPEGQYYFVVEATGYDMVEYSDPNIIETWKLNRGNKNNQPTGGTAPPGGEETTSSNLYTGWLYLYRNKGVY